MLASKRIRDYLKTFGDATVSEMSKALSLSPETVRIALRNMGDAYVDRWQCNEANNHWQKVYALADIPPDCPKPDDPHYISKSKAIDMLREMQPATASDIAEVLGLNVKHVSSVLRKSTLTHIVGKRRGVQGGSANLWAIK